MYINRMIHIAMTCTKSVNGSTHSLLLAFRGIVKYSCRFSSLSTASEDLLLRLVIQ